MKTHTFKRGNYHVELWNEPVEGLCDIPDEYETLRIYIQEGNDIKALDTALHEGLHADGIPEKYLHDKDGYADTMRISKFLWRLGYRRGK